MRALACSAALGLVLALAGEARAETKLEVTGTPKKAEVPLGEEIEVEVSVKNTGAEEVELAELTFDARSVSFELSVDGGTKSWDTQLHTDETKEFGRRFPMTPLKRSKLRPGEEWKQSFKIPAIAAGDWSITTVYAGATKEIALLAGITDEGTLKKQRDATPRTVKVPKGPNGETDQVARVATTLGTMTFKFFPKDCLATGLNFVRIARSGFYDGKTFHRLVPQAGVVQGGGTNADGRGHFPYTIPREWLLKHEKYRVGLARDDYDVHSGNSQFYILANDAAKGLDSKGYAIFAEVIKGKDVVDTLGAVPVSGEGRDGERPLIPLKIESVRLALTKLEPAKP